MGKGKEGDDKGEGRKGTAGGKGGPPSRIAKVQRWQLSVGVRQLCLRRIGVRGQKSLKTAAITLARGCD